MRKKIEKGNKIFWNLWQWALFTFIVGLVSGGTIEYVISPYVVPWVKGLLNPRGSLYVSVKLIEADQGVSGYNLSLLVLLKPGGELVDSVDPKEGRYRWENLEPGWYFVKAYVNNMYAGKTEELEIHPGGERREEIVTKVATGVIQVKVVSNDGTTPVEGAIVEMTCHRGVLWCQYPTDSKGETREIWLARTTEEHEYYNIHVYQIKDSKRSLVASQERVKLDKPRVKFTFGLP